MMMWYITGNTIPKENNMQLLVGFADVMFLLSQIIST